MKITLACLIVLFICLCAYAQVDKTSSVFTNTLSLSPPCPTHNISSPYHGRGTYRIPDKDTGEFMTYEFCSGDYHKAMIEIMMNQGIEIRIKK